MGNYVSLKAHARVAQAQFEGGVKKGRMVGPFSRDELAAFLECAPGDLIAGELAVFEEIEPSPDCSDGKYRVIFGATASRVNQLVRVRDQLEYPSAGELETIMRWAQKRAT